MKTATDQPRSSFPVGATTLRISSMTCLMTVLETVALPIAPLPYRNFSQQYSKETKPPPLLEKNRQIASLAQRVV